MEQEGSSTRSQEPVVMEFRPTYEEFKDFNSFIQQIESLGAHKAGFAKIIPPPEWKARTSGYDIEDIDTTILAPSLQKVHGQDGLYSMKNLLRKSMSVRNFREMALSNSYKTPAHTHQDDIEILYWDKIKDSPPVCSSSVAGSLMDNELVEWNLNALGSILDMGANVDVGINTARLNFGMFKTSLPWKLEEMDLYSISYHHFGAPRTWYSIPPQHGFRFETLINQSVPNTSKKCPAFIRHQNILVSPQVIQDYKIPYNKITQDAGEFVVTFPFGYHAAFDHGFNCTESTNFATTRWIDYGKRMHRCFCNRCVMNVDLDVLVETFQPERYVRWLMGAEVDRHPEETPAATESSDGAVTARDFNANQQPFPRGLRGRRRRRLRQRPYDAAALQEALNAVVASEAFQENRNAPEGEVDYEAAPEENSRENQEVIDALYMIVEDELDEWPDDPQLYLLNGTYWVEIYCISIWEVPGGFPNNFHNHNNEGALVLYSVDDTGNEDNSMQ